MVFYAGAGMPVQSTWQRLEAVAAKVRDGARVVHHQLGFSTETAPAVTFGALAARPRLACIGLPMPGIELKFVPVGGERRASSRCACAASQHLPRLPRHAKKR